MAAGSEKMVVAAARGAFTIPAPCRHTGTACLPCGGTATAPPTIADLTCRGVHDG